MKMTEKNLKSREKNVTLSRLLRTVLLITATASMSAQNDIMLRAGYPPDSSHTSAKIANILHMKVSQILNRNKAAAGGDFGEFIVIPRLSDVVSKSTSGLANNTTVTTGELTLTVANSYDNAEYFATTVPLRSVKPSLGNDPGEALASSINVTDATYVRFVRNARASISDYFANHCEEAIGRAKALADRGMHDNATLLLCAIPPSAPCAEEANTLLSEITGENSIPLPDHGSPSTPASSTVTTPHKATPSAKRASLPVVKSDDSPSSNNEKPELYVSRPGWDAEIASCVYDWTTKSILITLKIKSLERDADDTNIKMTCAISAEGDTFTYLMNKSNKYYFDFPKGVWIKVGFIINQVEENPGGMARLSFKINNIIDLQLKNVTLE